MTGKMIIEIHNFTQNDIKEKFFQRVIELSLRAVAFQGNKTEISLAIVGDGRMRKLNKLYRGKNRSTDVLSFVNKPAIDFLSRAFPRLKNDFIEPPDGVKRLGEIVICYPRAKKQAKQAGHSFQKELTILLIHGILHLLGYGHEKDEKEAKNMNELEKKILLEINNF